MRQITIPSGFFCMLSLIGVAICYSRVLHLRPELLILRTRARFLRMKCCNLLFWEQVLQHSSMSHIFNPVSPYMISQLAFLQPLHATFIWHWRVETESTEPSSDCDPFYLPGTFAWSYPITTITTNLFPFSVQESDSYVEITFENSRIKSWCQNGNRTRTKE